MTDDSPLRVRVTGDLGDDEVAEATRRLRSTLLQVADVSAPPGAAPVPGAKSGVGAALGVLLVSTAPAAIPMVLDTALGWLRRQTIPMEVEIDGQRLSGEVTRAQRDQIVQAFVRRVRPGDEEA